MIAPVLFGGALLPPTSSPLDDPSARGQPDRAALGAAGARDLAGGRLPGRRGRDVGDDRALRLRGRCRCSLDGSSRPADGAGTSWPTSSACPPRRWRSCSWALPGSTGKAFAIVSPVLLFAAFLACVWAWSERRFILGAGVAALLGVGVVWSNALAYNEANLAPRDQLAELEEIGEMLDGEGPVLMTEYQPYGVRHFLREAEAEGASELRRRTRAAGRRLDARQGPLGRHGRLPRRRVRAVRGARPAPLARAEPPSGRFQAQADRRVLRGVDHGTRASRRPPSGSRSDRAGHQWRSPTALMFARWRSGFPGGTLLAAESEEPVFLDGTRAARSMSDGGTYSVWLEGSVRGSATLEIDGEEIATVRHAPQQRGPLRGARNRRSGGRHPRDRGGDQRKRPRAG